jgi:hypothetical protein
MHDGRDLHRVERAPGVQVNEHRSARLRLLAHERGPARKREMHPRALHRLERLDGARELAFETALVIHLLEELARPETLALHQLEADESAFRQALRSELQTRVVDEIRRHEQRAAAFGEFVRHVHLRKRSQNGAAIAIAEIRIKDFVLGGRAPHPAADDERHPCRDDEHEREQLLRGNTGPRRQARRHRFG